MGVSTLYFYCAPYLERQKIGRPLVRIMRSSKEIEEMVLSSIVSLAALDPSPFQSFVSDFFIDGLESEGASKLKLRMLTLLSNEANIHRIINEFKYYVTRDDADFVASAIQSLGKCAMRLPDVL